MEDKIKSDEKLHSIMEGYSVKLTEEAEKRFSRRLIRYNFLRFRLHTFNIYTVTAIAVILFIPGFFIYKRNIPDTNNALPVIKTENISTDQQGSEIKNNIINKGNTIQNKHKNDIVLAKDTIPVGNSKNDTIKTIVIDTINKKIQVIVKDTVKIKKKIIRNKE